MSAEFQKFAYRKCEGNDTRIIVHYMGNKDNAVDFPHGKNFMVYKQQPSVAFIATLD